MAFIIEDGSGVAKANTYVSESFALAYLTERARETENGWSDADSSVKQGALVAATDYLENRFRECFKGQKEFRYLALAKGTLTFTGNPAATQTVVIGSRTYTFVAALSGANQVLIGNNASLSLDNLVDAIIADPAGEGVVYGTGTTAHADVSAREFEDDAIIVEALLEGVAGNVITTSTTVAGASWSASTLIGGTDTGRPQPLSFPRVSLYDRDGLPVVGIPDRLKFAVVEYAVRALAGALLPDPDVTTGLQVIEKEETVGPITERTRWQEGGRVTVTVPYPAADLLLRDYIFAAGGVLRA